MDVYEKACAFAARAHAGQTRKYTGEPYFTHCLDVAVLVGERTDDREMLAAAILHDTLEDTDTTYCELRGEFGHRVASLVLQLTDQYTKQAYPDKNRRERKRLEAERLGAISADAKVIKLCDLIDNTRSIVQYDPNFAVVYLREKADILEAMGFGNVKQTTGGSQE